MSCSRWLSIQSSLALATPVDSRCVSPELRRFDATRTSIPSTPCNTRVSLPCSRQTHRTLSERAPDQVSELLWRRRRNRRSSLFCGRNRCLVTWYRGNPPSLYLLHLAHEALEIRRNRPLRLAGGWPRNWSNPASRDQSLSFRQCFLSFVQCFLPGIQLRFPLSELLFSSRILFLARANQCKRNQQRQDESFFHITGGLGLVWW